MQSRCQFPDVSLPIFISNFKYFLKPGSVFQTSTTHVIHTWILGTQSYDYMQIPRL